MLGAQKICVNIHTDLVRNANIFAFSIHSCLDVGGEFSLRCPCILTDVKLALEFFSCICIVREAGLMHH
jgi:hypothetical protein